MGYDIPADHHGPLPRKEIVNENRTMLSDLSDEALIYCLKYGYEMQILFLKNQIVKLRTEIAELQDKKADLK